MLFQPTNITPSLRGELGNGTVDATKDLEVSWQVNGNSPLTAFSITLYKNDTASTQVYTTGKLTDNCPFYGTNYAGEIEFFSYTIAASALSDAGMVNGETYKIIIQQWWGDEDADSVTQASAAAFLARTTPTLSLGTIPPTLAARLYTFEATYTQEQGDALNWVRWQIALQSDVGNPLYDSHNIYGTAELKVSYDGFFSGGAYAVRCRVQTANGVEADTGWVSFQVSYPLSELTGVIDACQAKGQKSAIWVQWPLIAWIPGTGTGEWSIADGTLTLPADSSVTWNTRNGENMVLPAPWSVLWKGSLENNNATLFRLSTSGGVLEMVYSYSDSALYLTIGGTTLASWEEVAGKASVSVVLTPTMLYLYKLDYIGGLYPSLTLYPGVDLFPVADTIPRPRQGALPLQYNQGSILEAVLEGVQNCEFFVILKGVPAASIIQTMYNGQQYTPMYDANTYLQADFSNGLNAGNLGQDNSAELTGLALYRRKGSGGTLQHLADLPLNSVGLYDYGVASQQGPYVYYLFPFGEDTYIAPPIESEGVTPCFWNWSILSCVDGNRDGEYEVQAEYRFGKNLVSGSLSNNNSPNVLQNFTRYPTVQMTPANYLSGTLQSLIGIIDYTQGNGYSDTLAMRDAIYALSTTSNTLFLKNRKGDVLRIRISDATAMETMDNTREQAQTVSLSWAEIGTAEGVSLLAYTDIG